MPLSVVIGVPGVGKSTVMEELKKISPEKVKIIVFGDYMFDIAKKDGLVYLLGSSSQAQ
ncbi:MAG: AAA family ATPase [Candidatus Methanodesulfokora sp.]